MMMEKVSSRYSRVRRWMRETYKDFRWLLRQKTTYPMCMLACIALFLNADQNLISPNLTQIANEFNFTEPQKDLMLGGQLNIGFFIVGGLAAMIVGYLTDRVNRKNLFCAVTIIGEFSCFCTLFVKDYWGLFISRAVTGIAIGGANPLIFSMIGDMYDDRSRGKAISFIQIMLSLGIIVGQSVAGFIGPADALGWRAPFVAIAIPTFVLSPIFFFTTKDPPRGANEKAIKAMVEGDGTIKDDEVYEEKMDCGKLKILLMNKTAVLAFLQGIPGSLPWGVMLVFFQDFLVYNIGPQVAGGITVQQSTTVVLAFGAGSGIGLILGGFFADKLWKKDPRFVPLLMCVSTGIGALPIFGLINGPILSLAGYCAVTLPSGLLASMTGTAIRTVLMNVTLPETRGTAFAFHTLFDDIGRGLGPLWVGLLIEGTGGRIPGFNYSIGGWFVCSLILFAMIFTVTGDFRRLEAATKATAERRQQGLAIGSLVTVKEVDATPLEATSFGDLPEKSLPNDNKVRDSSSSVKPEVDKPLAEQDTMKADDDVSIKVEDEKPPRESSV